MKINKIILGLLALGFLLTACQDNEKEVVLACTENFEVPTKQESDIPAKKFSSFESRIIAGGEDYLSIQWNFCTAGICDFSLDSYCHRGTRYYIILLGKVGESYYLETLRYSTSNCNGISYFQSKEISRLQYHSIIQYINDSNIICAPPPPFSDLDQSEYRANDGVAFGQYLSGKYVRGKWQSFDQNPNLKALFGKLANQYIPTDQMDIELTKQRYLSPKKENLVIVLIHVGPGLAIKKLITLNYTHEAFSVIDKESEAPYLQGYVKIDSVPNPQKGHKSWGGMFEIEKYNSDKIQVAWDLDLMHGFFETFD